jgi:hypothetical protein
VDCLDLQSHQGLCTQSLLTSLSLSVQSLLFLFWPEQSSLPRLRWAFAHSPSVLQISIRGLSADKSDSHGRYLAASEVTLIHEGQCRREL